MSSSYFPLERLKLFFILAKRWDVWRAQDGVRLSFTSNLVQTHDGYLWLSTQSGLTRFDGIRLFVERARLVATAGLAPERDGQREPGDGQVGEAVADETGADHPFQGGVVAGSAGGGGN